MTDDRCLPDFGHLDQQLTQLGVRSLFLVADRGAFQSSGAQAKLKPLLNGREVTIFSDFVPNPQLPDVLAGLNAFRESKAAAVIAVGGGTAIDIGKLIVGMSNEESSPLSLVLNQSQFTKPGIPFIAVPTTAGTGSEATQFAVVYVEGKKYSVDHPKLMPGWCVLDAELTLNLPPRVTAQTGLDAFCQGVESIWSVRATTESVRDATESVQLAYQNLHAAVHRPNRQNRQAMLRASHLAGRAINQTRTTAPHAISYAITSDFGIPHGHAVSLTLAAMLIHNSQVSEDDVNDPRGPEHVRGQIQLILSILGGKTLEEGFDAIQTFVQGVGCETSLSELGIAGPDALTSIASKVNVERLSNNPRHLTQDQLYQILLSL